MYSLIMLIFNFRWIVLILTFPIITSILVINFIMILSFKGLSFIRSFELIFQIAFHSIMRVV